MKSVVRIGSFEISDSSPPFVIAEVGINHNGEIARAFEMIRVAKECGADAVKFQTFKVVDLIDDRNLTYTYKSEGKEITESMIDLFTRHELPSEAWPGIKQECDRMGIAFLSTPQNYSDLELLLAIGIDAIKVGSDDFTNIPLLRKYAATGKPLILSCGMADLAEIRQSLEAVGYSSGRPLVLLLCISEYPAPAESINLQRITSLKQTFPDLIVGFSDHSQGSLAASLSVGLGAKVIEKHFTLDRNLPGPDHWFSEDPKSLKEFVSRIRAASTIMGSGELKPSSAEYEMRKLARRSVVAKRSIAEGQTLTEEDLCLKRPGTGLPPAMLEIIIGKTCSRSLPKGEQLKHGDFF